MPSFFRAASEAFDAVPATWGQLTLREYESGDELEILETFNRVFGQVDPTFVPRTLAFWRWQFLENPSGSRILLALTPEGKVAGQFGAATQRMRLDGRHALFSQGIDHMSDPAFRRSLRKGSLLAVLGNTIARLHGGPGPDQDTVMWGAPVPAAWRVGKTLVRYEVIRSQLKLQASPVELRVRAASGIEVEEVESFPEDVVELFERAAPPHGAIAVRDKAQLDWRFAVHPERDYRIALARRAGRLAGYAVVTHSDFDGGAGEELLADWLVPVDDADAAHALRAWYGERGRTDGADRLTALFPDTVGEWIDFQRAGFRAAPTRYFVIGRQYALGYDMTWLRRHWYYTLGDTDLV